MLQRRSVWRYLSRRRSWFNSGCRPCFPGGRRNGEEFAGFFGVELRLEFADVAGDSAGSFCHELLIVTSDCRDGGVGECYENRNGVCVSGE